MEVHKWQLIVRIGCESVNMRSCNLAGKFSMTVSCSLSIIPFPTWKKREREKIEKKKKRKKHFAAFPGGAVVKNPPVNAGDTGLSPGPGRSHMPRSN